MPAWTVGKTREELEALALLAGFTGCAILGKPHVTQHFMYMQISLAVDYILFTSVHLTKYTIS